MRLVKALSAAALAFFGIGGAALGLAACGSNGSSGNGADGGNGSNDGTVSDSPQSGDGTSSGDSNGNVGDGGLNPDVFGGGDGSTCFAFGNGCFSSSDCCGGNCVNNVCTYPSCTADNGSCTSNGQCCSQTCGMGDGGMTCTPLNGMCSTIGNPCTNAGQCCSGYCASNGTCQASGPCGQIGDSCGSGGNCCSGVCTVASGQTLGTCGNPPTGSANCKMPDGMLCGGAGADGGAVFTDAGLPACGGGCCSRSCAPWGPTGVLICQPASGCHLVGDLCTNDNECCGSAAFPAADGGSQSMGGYATCGAMDGGVGVCQNPSGCKPNGDVCRLATNSCNSSCDCCSGNCHADTCRQDNLGIPRCSVAQCVNGGGACATSADCCASDDGGVGNPCVPGANGALTCYPSVCVPSCGKCTTSADCCPGSLCYGGTCGPCGGNPPPDGGTTPEGGTGTDGGGPVPDGGSPGGDSGICAAYGQICMTSADCCNGVPCTGGRCEVVLQ